jgi:hypothetical protein
MEAEMVEEDIVRPMSEGRKSRSFGELIRNSANEEEEELKWEALWRLPTYDRMRKGILKQVLDNGKVNYQEVDITKLGVEEKKLLLESIIKTAEEDNENFLHKMRDRIDRYTLIMTIHTCFGFIQSSQILIGFTYMFFVHCLL